MFGSSFVRSVCLCGTAILVVLACEGAARAGSNNGDAPPVYEDDYSGPPIIRRIPGLRLLFGDPTTSGDNGAVLDGDKKKKKNSQFDDSYYEPEPAPVAKPKAVTPPATPAASKPPADPALPQKTANAAPAQPLADGPLSCEKATAVVAGFGFSSVEASSCSGKLYAFNAKRGGKNFAIKLDPASGQLTEVKKLP